MADTEAKNTGPLNLPMQPTGSGVVDLEIAREQDALAADGDLAGAIDAEVPVSPAAERDLSKIPNDPAKTGSDTYAGEQHG